MDSMDFVKKRLEKDLVELKKMIDSHFLQRKSDESELQALEDRMTKRQDMRKAQVEERQRKEKERAERDKIEKERKEAEALKLRTEEAERKKAAMAALNSNFKGGERQERKKGRGTGRDTKKKALTERRKPLNIDHLDVDRLKEKSKELWEHLKFLEGDRFDFDMNTRDQKYEVTLLRYRVNTLSDMGNKQKSKRVKLR